MSDDQISDMRACEHCFSEIGVYVVDPPDDVAGEETDSIELLVCGTCVRLYETMGWFIVQETEDG